MFKATKILSKIKSFFDKQNQTVQDPQQLADHSLRRGFYWKVPTMAAHCFPLVVDLVPSRELEALTCSQTRSVLGVIV